jgi:4-hydroxybenzoate polyprenyltransferase
MRFGAIVRLLRPKQWTKNLLVFAGLLFTGSFEQRDLVLRALIAFAAMCLASSGTYAVNDALDASRDRLHPSKKGRPVATGEIAPLFAILIGFVLMAAGCAAAFLLNMASGLTVSSYLVLQAVYNGALKRIPVADVFGLSLGFVLRAVLGATCIAVVISGWLLFCTGALALLLGFAKRRHEFHAQGEDRSSTRESLGGYTGRALDALVLLAAGVASICYGIYSLESPTAESHPALFLTTPFVFYGICRYVYLIFAYDEGGEPESVLLRDPHIWGSVAAFVAMAALAMSGVEIPVLEGIGRTSGVN